MNREGDPSPDDPEGSSQPRLADLLASAQAGDQVQRPAINTEQVAAHLRIVNQGVLVALEDEGVIEAVRLNERLEGLDQDAPEHPLGATLEDVAASYEAELPLGHDPAKGGIEDELERSVKESQLMDMAALARAAHYVSLSHAVRAVTETPPTPQDRYYFGYARDEINNATRRLPKSTTDALAEVLKMAHLPPEPPQGGQG